MSKMQNLFLPADILLPKTAFDMTKYSVVACDQYTSQRDVWEQAKSFTEGVLSTLDMIFPEVYLNDGEQAFAARISSINQAMEQAVKDDVFVCYPDSYFYIERTQRNGAVRRGLIGRIDLEAYNFAHSPDEDVQTAVRATEGTVLSRIPPRVRIRENAPLELPHVMLLVDDPDKTCIEVIGTHTDAMQKVYNFDLMQDSGHLTGWKVNAADVALIDALVDRLSDQADFEKRYGLKQDSGKRPLVFAVGDGNHSLATARQCWDNLKANLSEAERENHPARYALVELCNLHDDALVFEPIHRIVFDVDPDRLLKSMTEKCGLTTDPDAKGQWFTAVVQGKKTAYCITKPDSQLTVGSVQNFLDAYVKENGGEVDYIHGADVVMELSEKEQTFGVLLSSMKKEELFPTVVFDRALPRKTFSMGDAWDKRFYCEARKIR